MYTFLPYHELALKMKRSLENIETHIQPLLLNFKERNFCMLCVYQIPDCIIIL